MEFTGRSFPRTISMPDDLWDVMLEIAHVEYTTLSGIMQRAATTFILARTEQRHGTLVDTKCEYVTEGQ